MEVSPCALLLPATPHKPQSKYVRNPADSGAGHRIRSPELLILNPISQISLV